MRKLTVAIPQAVIHDRAFRAFTESIRLEHHDAVKEWESQVVEWEADPSKFCPYDLLEERASHYLPCNCHLIFFQR